MLDYWSRIVFDKIAERLLHASMKLIEKERNGELVDSRLIVGVRESFGKCKTLLQIVERVFLVDLCVDCTDPLEKYSQYFEKCYLDATERFYKNRTAQVLCFLVH